MALNYLNRFIGNRELVKKTLTMSTTFFFLAWGAGFVTPVLNIYFKQVAGDFFFTGLLISILGIMGIIFAIPAGVLCDKFDTKRINQVSLLILSIVPLFFIFTKNPGYVLIIRAVEAVFSTLLWSSIWTHVYREVDNHSTASEVGFLSMSYDAAATISPIIGGVIATVSFFLPFYIWSIFTFIALALVTIKMKPMPPSKIDSFTYLVKKDWQILKEFLTQHKLSTVTTIFSYSLAAVVGSFLPILLFMSGLDYAKIGIVLAITYIPVLFLEVPIGEYIDKVGRGRALLLGILTLCLCTIAFALTLNFYLVLMIMVVFGISQVTTFIAATSITCDLSGKDGKGLMSGARRFILSVGTGSGPLIGGALFVLIGYSTTMLLFAFAGLALTIFYIFWKGENI